MRYDELFVAPSPDHLRHFFLDPTMIDIRKLKELVRLMVENDLSELDLQDQQETVTIKRGGTPVAGAPFSNHAPAAATPSASAAAPADAGDEPKAEVEVKDTQ